MRVVNSAGTEVKPAEAERVYNCAWAAQGVLLPEDPHDMPN